MKSPAAFYRYLDRGYQRRHLWQAKINEIAEKLDKIDMPDEAVGLLQELFEHIGERG